MERVDLPRALRLKTRTILVWTPAPALEPNPELLKALNKRARSKSGVKQSEISKQRQRFITGMSVYRMTADELKLKNDYLEEWHARGQIND